MKLTLKIISILLLAVILFMVPAGIFILKNQQETILQQANARARTLFQIIVVTRQWVAENRDRIEPVPAVATKELSRYADYMADFRFRISSDRLINPENAPSEFEKRAIVRFRQGAEEYYEKIYDKDSGGNLYVYAAPLITNESCLPCHSFQGFEDGDFHGVISIVIPLKDLEEANAKTNIMLVFTFIAGFTIIITIISFLLYRLTENEETLKTKLKEQNEQLGTLNQMKTDILDSISHEIRTPLTKIMSYSELLSDPRLQSDSKGRQRFTESLKRNISSISGMFNDIITMSRLEHGQHTYHKIPIAIKKLLQDIVDIYEAEITNKNLIVELDIDESVLIPADGESLRYVLSNIFSNAVKYSHKGGRVTIKAFTEGKKSVLTFYDEGVGIPPKDLPNVGTRFCRGTNVKNEYPGTGLGLSIVSRVVGEHGGEFRIESEEGRYTKVTITLPLE